MAFIDHETIAHLTASAEFGRMRQFLAWCHAAQAGVQAAHDRLQEVLSTFLSPTDEANIRRELAPGGKQHYLVQGMAREGDDTHELGYVVGAITAFYAFLEPFRGDPSKLAVQRVVYERAIFRIMCEEAAKLRSCPVEIIERGGVVMTGEEFSNNAGTAARPAGAASIEYHRDCGGVVRTKNTISALEWRCDRCHKLVPVDEVTTTTPATSLRNWLAINLLANPVMPLTSIQALARRTLGTARGVAAALTTMVAEGDLTLVDGVYGITVRPGGVR